MSQSPQDVPVLFVVFNQPEVTRRTFAAIRAARPKKLFVSADGPRTHKPAEREECERVRRIVQEVDWDCEVKTLFNEENLGCKVAVSRGISWFFKHVEAGIILEYDCLPSPTFFRFAADLLTKYREDKQVMCISGDNFQFGNKRGTASYYFSRIPLVWGWATWRDRWQHWDGDLTSFPEFRDQGKIHHLFWDRDVCRFWQDTFEAVHDGRNSTTWAYPWDYAVFSRNGLCVVPNSNLVTNIGFSAHATHATDTQDMHAGIPHEELGEITHPAVMTPDVDADQFFIRNFTQMTLRKSLTNQLKRTVKSFLPPQIEQPLRRAWKRWQPSK